MALNDMYKRNGGERWFWVIYTVKFVPVLFILTVIIWSYYAYVFELCSVTIQTSLKQIIYLAIYHTLFIIFMWSYWKTVFTSIGYIPEKFKLTISFYDRLEHAVDETMQRAMLHDYASDLPHLNFTPDEGIRYCDKCRIIKPDRAHHCSVCGQCVLKMDHHCPWVNNCISFTNYKFFMLFMGYGLLYCFFICMTTVEFFIAFWKGELVGAAKFHILFLFFVSIMFGVSLMSLFGYHCFLIYYNRTTLEAFRPPVFLSGIDKHGYDLGGCLNFQQVFGNNPTLWFLPLYTSLGDGVTYPAQSRHQPSSYHSMDTTHTRLE